MKIFSIFMELAIIVFFLSSSVYTADFEVQYPSGRKIVCLGAYDICFNGALDGDLFHFTCGLWSYPQTKVPIDRICICENATPHYIPVKAISYIDLFRTTSLGDLCFQGMAENPAWPVTVHFTNGDSLSGYTQRLSFSAIGAHGEEIKINHVAAVGSDKPYPNRIIVNPKKNEDK